MRKRIERATVRENQRMSMRSLEFLTEKPCGIRQAVWPAVWPSVAYLLSSFAAVVVSSLLVVASQA